MLEYVLKFMFS